MMSDYRNDIEEALREAHEITSRLRNERDELREALAELLSMGQVINILEDDEVERYETLANASREPK